jgi:uncharacterized OB-fold protein
MNETIVSQARPMKAGVLKVGQGEGEGVLLGIRCRGCGDAFHPVRATCASCFSEDVEEVDLGTKGRILTYTVSHVQMPGSPVAPPFVTAVVEMPGAVRLLSLITDIDPNRVEIGQEVNLYFFKAGEDEDGTAVTAYAFKP